MSNDEEIIFKLLWANEMSLDLRHELKLFLASNQRIRIETGFNIERDCQECIIHNDDNVIAIGYGSMSIIAIGKALETVKNLIDAGEIYTTIPMTKECREAFEILTAYEKLKSMELNDKTQNEK